MENFSEAFHRLDVEEVKRNYQHFGAVDYILFFGMMIASMSFGIFHVFRKKNVTSGADEYLFAGRDMAVFPVTMSILASLISGVGMLGLPVQVYLTGMSYAYINLTSIPGALLAYFIILPVLHELKLPSLYEYFYLRFDNRIRWVTSLSYIIQQTLRLTLQIYLPSVTLSQVTGINLHVLTSITALTCILYTCIGGIRVVVWTDVMQAMFIVLSVATIITIGLIHVGGFNVVWNYAVQSGRMNYPPLTLDLTTEITALNLILGGVASSLNHSTLNQNIMQRYNMLPTRRKMVSSLIMVTLCDTVFLIVNCSIGLLAYAVFNDCDPITSKLVDSANQLIPVLVMQVAGEYTGFPGILIVGIFSASLSSLSTILNSLSGVLLEDFIKPWRRTPFSERKTVFILKALVGIIGLIGLGLVPIVERSKAAVFAFAFTFDSAVSGPLLGVFLCGLLIPFVDANGVFWGVIVSTSLCFVMAIGNQVAQFSGQVTVPHLPLTTDNCTYNFPLNNVTSTITVVPEDVFYLFRISYVWYPFFGCVITIALSAAVSYCSGNYNTQTLNPRYFNPFVRKWVPQPGVSENEEEIYLNQVNEN